MIALLLLATQLWVRKDVRLTSCPSQNPLPSLRTWTGTFLKTLDWKRALKIKLFSGTTSWPEIGQHLACLQYSIWLFIDSLGSTSVQKILESSQSLQQILLRSARLKISYTGTCIFTTLEDQHPDNRFTFLKLKTHFSHPPNQPKMISSLIDYIVIGRTTDKRYEQLRRAGDCSCSPASREDVLAIHALKHAVCSLCHPNNAAAEHRQLPPVMRTGTGQRVIYLCTDTAKESQRPLGWSKTKHEKVTFRIPRNLMTRLTLDLIHNNPCKWQLLHCPQLPGSWC